MPGSGAKRHAQKSNRCIVLSFCDYSNFPEKVSI
jgi:hypothetical protein